MGWVYYLLPIEIGFPVEAVIEMALAGYWDSEAIGCRCCPASSGDRFCGGYSIGRLK
jgi:hypothetical protein